MKNLKTDEGRVLSEDLDGEEIIRIIESMPERANPEEIASLITSLILAYEIPTQWSGVSTMVTMALNQVNILNSDIRLH